MTDKQPTTVVVPTPEVAQPIKEGINHAVQATGDVFGTILTTVSGGIASAVKKVGNVGVSIVDAVAGVVRTAVRGSLGVGSDVAVGSKAIVMGVIKGTGEKDEAALKTLSLTARTVIRQTAEMNGDVGAAATGLVLGAIASAKSIGMEPSMAASAVRTAAIEEADAIGSVAAERVRTALKNDIGGINFPKPSKA